MLKNIKSLKLKKKEIRSGRILMHESKSVLEPPKIPLKFFCKVHKVKAYEEVLTSFEE